VRLSESRVEKTLAPNSVELVDLQLSAVEKVMVADLAPLRVNWTAIYEDPRDVQPVRARGTHRIVIDQHFTLHRVKGIAVDGALADWKEFPFGGAEPGQVLDEGGGLWTGPRDGSLRFATGYDDEFLYIAVEAFDDDSRRNPRQGYTRQDSVQIRVDASPDNDGETLHIAAIPGVKNEEAGERASLPKLPDGVTVVSLPADNGHRTEAAIPLTYFTNSQGPNWEKLRVNVGMNDGDADGLVALWWRPSWNSPADYPASGTFIRK
jgi:hypothetical protein